MPITDEDADRIARAHSREFSRNFWHGCGCVVAFILISAAIITLLSMR